MPIYKVAHRMAESVLSDGATTLGDVLHNNLHNHHQQQRAAPFAKRTPADEQMVLRRFLFSIAPGRRVPPITRASTGGSTTTSSAKDAPASEEMSAGAAKEFRRKVAEAEAVNVNVIKHRVTATHAQELLAVSRTLRGNTGDRPANRPLEVGTLTDRCLELLHYHDRCNAAAAHAASRRRDGRDANTSFAAPRIAVAGLNRDARRRLQQCARTYSTERADYATGVLYDQAMDLEDGRAMNFVSGSRGSFYVDRDGVLHATAAQEPHRKRVRGAPILRVAHRDFKEAPPAMEAGVRGFEVIDAVSTKTAGVLLVDAAEELRRARASYMTRGARPTSSSLPLSLEGSLDGLSPATSSRQRAGGAGGRSPPRPMGRASSPRPGSPHGSFNGGGGSPRSGGRTKAARRVRRELVEAGVSNLGAAVLSAHVDTVENFRCETHASRDARRKRQLTIASAGSVLQSRSPLILALPAGGGDAGAARSSASTQQQQQPSEDGDIGGYMDAAPSSPLQRDGTAQCLALDKSTSSSPPQQHLNLHLPPTSVHSSPRRSPVRSPDNYMCAASLTEKGLVVVPAAVEDVEEPISEYSRRTCIHDERPPRRLIDVLRDKFQGNNRLTAFAGVKSVKVSGDDPSGSNGSELDSAQFLREKQEEALRLRLPTPAAQNRHPSDSWQRSGSTPLTAAAAVFKSHEDVLARTELSSKARAVGALQAVLANRRRAATPSIPKQHTLLTLRHNR
jgi:hypothetical protein